MAGRNTGIPPDQRLEYRIGINIGDIILDDGDIYGDGVNIAARLETLAEPGGICVSRIVRDQVRDKIELAFADLGEHQVRNIARPLRVYRVAALSPGCSSTDATAVTTGLSPAVLTLPDRPSIAVLPFPNLSGDTGQDYFADGLVEDIITGLSRIRWLFVIARNSSFVYKGEAVELKQVGRELGVRYVLEGGIRKAGSRVRVTTKLIETDTGVHVWAERYDRSLDDIFALQDEITMSVVGAIDPQLRHVEMERARRKPTESVNAYDLYLRALAQFRSSYEENLGALQLLRRAIEIDPHYAAPYGLAAWCYTVQRTRSWVSPSNPALAEGIIMAKQAAALGRDDSETLWMAGRALAQLSGDLEGGIALIDRAVTLNPNSAGAWRASGHTRAELGDAERAISDLERSARLSPLDDVAYVSIGFVFAHFMAGRYEEASVWCDKTLHERPDYPPALRMKAAICGLLGRQEEGRRWVECLLAVNPDATVTGMLLYYKVFMKNPGSLGAFVDGLRKAGLPE